MPRPEKVATVEEIREKLSSASAAVLTEYRGLKVGDLAALRASLRSADAEYKIFKNTLARRAAEEAGLSDLAALLDGPTAITFVRGDAVVVAKALRDYARTNPALVVKGGVLGTRVIRSQDVVALADIEPREVLLARIAGGFQAPLTKAAGLFQAFTRNMAYGIKALIDKRVEAGEPAEAPAAAGEPAGEATPPAEEPLAAAPSAAEVDGPAPAEAGSPTAAASEAAGSEIEGPGPVPAPEPDLSGTAVEAPDSPAPPPAPPPAEASEAPAAGPAADVDAPSVPTASDPRPSAAPESDDEAVPAAGESSGEEPPVA